MSSHFWYEEPFKFDERFNSDGTRKKHSNGTKRKIAGALAGAAASGVVGIGVLRFRNLSRAAKTLDRNINRIRFSDALIEFALHNPVEDKKRKKKKMKQGV